MKRLNHVLPDWTRVQWTNIENKQKYEPLISSVSTAWRHIERMSVVHGVRLCTLDSINSSELVSLTEEYAKYGVFVVPLAKEGMARTYSSTSQPYVSGKPYRVRVVFTKSEELAREWYTLWNTSPLNNRRIGELLGYPECCIDFYLKHWEQEKFVDTTWPMSVNGVSVSDNDTIIHIKEDTPPEANILWRWQGVRLVSHLPCSFNCSHTVDIGIKNAELGRKLGYGQLIDSMYELLSWPVEWSALHGIAEIKTPINKISSRTDMTPWKYTVQKHSNVYPEDGASGTMYPWTEKKIKIKPITTTKSFIKSLEDTSVWEENGFAYKEAMDHFHEVVIDAIGDMKYVPAGNVLDLGCGNGVLLGRVVGNRSDLIPHGVEMDRQRCMSAATTIHWGYFTMGNIFDLNTWKEDYYSLVLLMPGRLIETSPENALKLRKQLYEKTDLLLINLTCDWTLQYKTIYNMMKLTQLDLDWEPAGSVIYRKDDMAQLFKRKV
jgi:hypothetical protein